MPAPPVAYYVRGPWHGQEIDAQLNPDGSPVEQVQIEVLVNPSVVPRPVGDGYDLNRVVDREGVYKIIRTVDWRARPVYVWQSAEWPVEYRPRTRDWPNLQSAIDLLTGVRVSIDQTDRLMRGWEYRLILPPYVAPGLTQLHQVPVQHAAWAAHPYVALRALR